jgi:hypothetical protein
MEEDPLGHADQLRVLDDHLHLLNGRVGSHQKRGRNALQFLQEFVHVLIWAYIGSKPESNIVIDAIPASVNSSSSSIIPRGTVFFMSKARFCEGDDLD